MYVNLIAAWNLVIAHKSQHFLLIQSSSIQSVVPRSASTSPGSINYQQNKFL